ncbi:transposase [Christiangramia sp.]|uniref:transposase n=1 Tax=Christiangramia sp. TaxID=1931228 RepID=UPI00345BE741
MDEKNQKVYEFLSNNFLFSPKKWEIYKHRWKIETMFNRLKQNFPLKNFSGDSPNAIKTQIL